MFRFLPFLLPIVLAIVYARFVAWRTARELDEKSIELVDGGLRPVLARLSTALGLPRIKVHLYEVAMVNGLAAPDGRIFITRGFYDKYRSGEVSAEEMGSVVAHELGHVALGHSRRRMIDFTGQNAVRMVLMMVLGRFVPVVGPWLAQALMGLLAAGLSRRDEFEADAYATALMLKAGLGAAPQKSLFRKLGALSGRKGAEPPAWLLTHPKVEARIAAIEGNEARWLPPPAGPA